MTEATVLGRKSRSGERVIRWIALPRSSWTKGTWRLRRWRRWMRGQGRRSMRRSSSPKVHSIRRSPKAPIQSTPRTSPMPEITLIEGLRQAMDEELARDERVFIVGEDVGPRGGVFRATQGLFEKYGAGRVIDSPLAELSIVGVGIGAALYGMRPICEIQFADFIHPAFNQIVNEAAKMCYRSNGEWTVPLVIRAPYGGGIGGGLYHSQSVEAFYAHVPGLKVVIPSNPHDAKGLLKAAVRDPNPVVFLEPKKGYRLIKGEVAGPGEILEPLGVARVTRPPTH